MRIAIACGGTGGHIFPGLATAQELMDRGHDVTLWLAGKDVEGEAVKGWAGKVVTVPAQGLPSGFSAKSISASFKLVRAIVQVKRGMKKAPPDVVLAMGSYASVGPVGAALLLGIPVVLHESNVVPGRAVRFLSRWATCVAGCFDETRFYLRRRNLVLTGMPLRQELLGAALQPLLPRSAPRILVMGGSRGARALNEMVPRVLVRLRREGLPFAVTHLAGEQDAETVAVAYRDGGVEAHVIPFTRKIGEVYAQTDFAICRSGAASCAELSAFGIPALLIPYPHAIHDHQTENARAMEKAGAADMVPEKDLSDDWLATYITQMIKHEDRRRAMSDASRVRASGNGAKQLSDLVEKTVRGTGHRHA